MFAYDRLIFNTNDLLSDSDEDSDTIYTSMISPLRYVLIFVGVIRTNDRTQTGSSYPPSVTALVIYHNCIGRSHTVKQFIQKTKKYPETCSNRFFKKEMGRSSRLSLSHSKKSQHLQNHGVRENPKISLITPKYKNSNNGV